MSASASSPTGLSERSTPTTEEAPSSPPERRTFLRSANDELPNTDLGTLLFRNSVRIRNLHFSLSVTARKRLLRAERENERLRRKLVKQELLTESLRLFFKEGLTPAEYAHLVTPVSVSVKKEIRETRKQLLELERMEKFFNEK